MGAKIPMPPQNMESGIREFFVEDPDGHIIRFGQNIPPVNRSQTDSQPANIRIIETLPPGANPLSIVYSVVAEDISTGQPIGGAHLLGDNAGFFYVKDVYVHPDWRGRGIGTALMKALSDWLDKNTPGKASVWLHTAGQLMPFYKQFGFTTVPGMARFFPPRD
jgi:GNAT superfamily N-acetyltransferase